MRTSCLLFSSAVVLGAAMSVNGPFDVPEPVENAAKSAAAAYVVGQMIKHQEARAQGEYAKDRTVDMAVHTADAKVIDPMQNIIAHHDKAQIAHLKSSGKISEGFTELAFVHIPKTGGDALSLASTPIFPYGFGLRSNLALNLMVDKAKQGPNHCFFEQLPPKEVTAMYSKRVFEEAYEKRDVFCAVRNPYDRVVSEWHNCLENGNGKCGNTCDANDMNNYVQNELVAFQKGDYLRNMCSFIPQRDYLEGEGGCKHVLNFANLETEFNALMKTRGYTLTLPAKSETHRSQQRLCQDKVTSKHLTPSTRRLIEMVYAKDFEEWSTSFGWKEETTTDKMKRFLMAPIKALTSTLEESSNAVGDAIFTELPEPSKGHSD